MSPAIRRALRPVPLLGSLVTLAVLCTAQGAGAVPPVYTISATAAPSEVPIGAAVTVSGVVSGVPAATAGTAITLEAAPYPFRRYAPLAQAQAAADGSFSLATGALSRDTRLRVSLPGDPASTSKPLLVTVDPRIAIHARSLGPGRERLSMRIVHSGAARAVRVNWYLGAGTTNRLAPAATTTSREIAPGVTYASVIVNPPAKRFTYRVCLNPPWQASMGPAAQHGSCPRRGVGATGTGRGIPEPPYPSANAIAAARSYLEGRAGSTSLAVVDSAGRLSGLNLRARFETASVIKVMFLTAYLQHLAAHHQALGSADNAILYPMIHESNNEDASAVLGAVGEPAVERVAREAGMDDYVPGVGWWAYSYTSAADQARFFLALPRLVPRRFWPYARGLMAGIEPSQSWGFPPVARPRGWQVFFKTGALPEAGLFNEVARLERGNVTFTVAVLTNGDPSMAYGEETIEGVAARLLAGAP